MKLVAYITDLFFEAKLSQAAQEAGVQLKVVSSIYKFLPELQDPPSLIVVDLNANGISPTSLIAQVKTRHASLPVIAYGTDDQPGLMEQALEAGADKVMHRNVFSDTLTEILAELKK